MNHEITLEWDEGMDTVTGTEIARLKVGDTISFRTKPRGTPLVVFANGSPFSSKLLEVITDTDSRAVTEKGGPYHFSCGVIADKDHKLHANGAGVRVPPVHS